MRALALDMGGTHIACGVVDGDRLLVSTSIDTDSTGSLRDLLPRLTETLQSLLAEVGMTANQCAGIAVGFPGIISSRETRIYSTLKKYEDAPGLDLSHWAKKSLGLELRIENDARMALLGEQFAGAAHGVHDVVMMTFGTGIGSAAILQGRILRGVHGHAGCLGGHLTTNFDGRTCQCGNTGCAEAEASGWSMPLVAREQPGFSSSSLSVLNVFGFRELFAHADAGDHLAITVRDRCLRVWAANAVSLIHAYDPVMLILGGGVMGRGDIIVPFIQEYVNQHTWSSWGKTQIRAAALRNEAALLGAVPLLSEDIHGE